MKDKAEACKRYYAKYKEGICAIRKSRYYLLEPKADVKEMCIKELQRELMVDRETKNSVLNAFKKQPRPL